LESFFAFVNSLKVLGISGILLAAFLDPFSSVISNDSICPFLSRIMSTRFKVSIRWMKSIANFATEIFWNCIFTFQANRMWIPRKPVLNCRSGDYGQSNDSLSHGKSFALSFEIRQQESIQSKFHGKHWTIDVP
jgi:hypothetical protein